MTLDYFRGERTEVGATKVVVGAGGQERPLDLRLDLRSHSPTGFEWGYAGSGPSQLALAICARLVGDLRAVRVYQTFKETVIAPIRTPYWRIEATEALAAIERIEREARP